MDQHVAVPKPFVGPTLRVGVLLAVAILAAFGAWIVLERGRTGETSAPPAAPADGPRIMTADGLTALAGLQGSSVYWAGPRPDVVYEVTKTTKGYVFVRYLPGGTSPGDPRPDFLTVATYPRPTAYADVRAASKRPGAVAVALPHGGLAVYDVERPTSVYVAYRRATQQVEVYDPSAREALRLVKTGFVRPVP